MNKKNSVLCAEGKTLFRYNSNTSSKAWEVELGGSVREITRVNQYVFTTYSRKWGTLYTTLLNYETGEIRWTIKKTFINVILFEGSIYHLTNRARLECIDLNSGEEKFKIKTGFNWSIPKLVTINSHLFLFSSKKTMLVNPVNGSLRPTKLPNGFNAKKISFILDEFEIKINTPTETDSGNAGMGLAY